MVGLSRDMKRNSHLIWAIYYAKFKIWTDRQALRDYRISRHTMRVPVRQLIVPPTLSITEEHAGIKFKKYVSRRWINL
jgi:hypothetical protein